MHSVMSRHMAKPAEWPVHPVKTQISLGIHSVCSECSLSAWRSLESLAIHWVHSKDSDQTGWMPRLIWDVAGRTVIFVGFVMWQLYIYFQYLSCLSTSSSSDKLAFDVGLQESAQGKMEISNLKPLMNPYWHYTVKVKQV